MIAAAAIHSLQTHFISADQQLASIQLDVHMCSTSLPSSILRKCQPSGTMAHVACTLAGGWHLFAQDFHSPELSRNILLQLLVCLYDFSWTTT